MYLKGECKVLFSKFIDHYALYQLHKKKSKISQFTKPKEIMEPIQREDFYQVNTKDVQVNIDYDKDIYLFNSIVTSEFPINDLVSGEVYLHAEGAANPNVIFVHGWRMNSYSKLKNMYHSRMSQLGWNMYYFPLAYHMECTPPHSLYNGELMISANIDRTVAAARQSIIDLRTLIHSIKLNNDGPIILVGVSLGGWITNLIATLESELNAVVSVFYANRLAYSIWNTIPGRYIKEDLLQNGIDYKALLKHWEITDPSLVLPKIKKDNILLISGKYDQYISLEDADYLWQSWGKPPRKLYNCGHSGIVLQQKRIAEDTITFIQERIKSG